MSLYAVIKKNLEKFTLNVKLETSSGVLGLLGASGCGKSMTLKCISGIEKPDSGKIILDGVTLFDSERRIDLPPQRRRIGYLFQSYALFPNMSVRQNIMCGIRGVKDRAERERAFGDALEMMHLRGLENRRPAQLSGGEQQRTALARILAGKPELLMLDEPFSALDSHLRGQLQVQMQHLLKDYGRDTIMVTHSRDEAYKLCSRIALVDFGRVLALKDTKELFADPESRAAALLTGCKNVVDATKTGEYEVEVPEWGVRLTTAKQVRDGLCAIAIRAHYFNPRCEQNSYPVCFTGEMEEPFEYILNFRFEKQTEDSPDIWWRLPKDRRGTTAPERLGIAPINVLPLYE